MSEDDGDTQPAQRFLVPFLRQKGANEGEILWLCRAKIRSFCGERGREGGEEESKKKKYGVRRFVSDQFDPCYFPGMTSDIFRFFAQVHAEHGIVNHEDVLKTPRNRLLTPAAAPPTP